MSSNPIPLRGQEELDAAVEERVPLYRVKVLYDYSPNEMDELSLHKNQLLEVISLEEDPWYAFIGLHFSHTPLSCCLCLSLNLLFHCIHACHANTFIHFCLINTTGGLVEMSMGPSGWLPITTFTSSTTTNIPLRHRHRHLHRWTHRHYHRR